MSFRSRLRAVGEDKLITFVCLHVHDVHVWLDFFFRGSDFRH